jgi:hypothetical protein
MVDKLDNNSTYYFPGVNSDDNTPCRKYYGHLIDKKCDIERLRYEVGRHYYEALRKFPIPAMLITAAVAKGKREADRLRTEFRLLLLEKYSYPLP